MLTRTMFAVAAFVGVLLAIYYRILAGSAGTLLTLFSVPCVFYLMLYFVDLYNYLAKYRMRRLDLQRREDRWKL
jgi:hypothetical protein